MGDYQNHSHVDYIRHANIYITNIVTMDERLEYSHEMYPTGPPPNEHTTRSTKTSTMRLAGVAQPPDSRRPGPLTDLFTTNMVIGTRYPSASADRSLVEIQVIADIMDTLMESPALRHSETLPETLASLRRMLTLTELAVHAYKNTPLAEALSHNLAAQVEQCRQLLRELLNDLTNYRYALSGAMLHFIRQYVWGNIGESGAVSVLNSKLQECHTSFASCILALGRAAWPELEQRPQAEAVALADFYSLLQQESASLRHIKVDTVIVVDHLGRNLPVPKIFCNSWQSTKMKNKMQKFVVKFAAVTTVQEKSAYVT
ncbi:hypothetical protein FIBSPDRAFT_1046259 [Athelia psychrophila]|uniref:Uncharacterized protein n=1 Tax=Athelia psychrophila TaxID=1759441 RepID=A0A166H1I7_9AGAM|nr:hypothetical protein FIBSPDRAFT_1046259 [Fibularhizoctonia sp. CBS 109695]